MAIDPTTTDLAGARLNELYWDTSRTIDEIINELGVGRNTLYAAIHPLETGYSCVTCSDVLVYTNRMNRASGTATCITCGEQTPITAVSSGQGQQNATAGGGTAEGRYAGARGWDRWREDLGAVSAERAAMIGGAAVLGIMVGAAAVKAMRR